MAGRYHSRMSTALVIIDMQNGLLSGHDSVARSSELLHKVQGLLERARGRGIPVVFVQDADVGGGSGPDWELHAALAPRPGEKIVHKLACDAFHETELDAHLRGLAVDTLIIAGVKTEFCVDTTCRRATSMGYAVTLVADAHATSSTPELDADAVIRHHNRLLHGFGAMVRGRPCGIDVIAAHAVLME